MQTRSKTMYENNKIYSVEINFDEASILWRENKVSMGNGCYKYQCRQKSIKGNLCIKKCLPGEHFCSVHYKMLQKRK